MHHKIHTYSQCRITSYASSVSASANLCATMLLLLIKCFYTSISCSVRNHRQLLLSHHDQFDQ